MESDEDLTEKLKENINRSAKDFIYLNGLIFKTPDLSSVQIAPVTLYPSNFPETFFQYAVRIQKDFQVLFNKISRDHVVLENILKRVIVTDDYMKNLWHIYEKVLDDGLAQSVFLYLVRNDYMIHLPVDYRNLQQKWSNIQSRPGISLKQIEYNLMASSFGGFAQKIVPFHISNCNRRNKFKLDMDKIPPNKPADGLAKGIMCAWKVYKNPCAIILFIVSPKERNVYDQRVLENSIYEINPNVIVLRKTFEECFNEGVLNEQNKRLTIKGEEVAVIYYRDGYIPEHFYNEKIWASKLMLERSCAIKSPNIQQMLVNTKLVQQALCDFSLLSRYLSQTVAHELSETFANQYLLDDAEKIQKALQRPNDYVLKPQREGGGNNYFDDEFTQKLKSIQTTEERHEYVMMQRIFPPQFKNTICRPNGEISTENLVSELGIYGVFLGSETEVYANYQCGHILRSKCVNVNESGVAAGFGFIDSPYLI